MFEESAVPDGVASEPVFAEYRRHVLVYCLKGDKGDKYVGRIRLRGSMSRHYTWFATTVAMTDYNLQDLEARLSAGWGVPAAKGNLTSDQIMNKFGSLLHEIIIA